MKEITDIKRIKGKRNPKNKNILGSVSLDSKKMDDILDKYLNYENSLETQALRNGFGKMVSARNITNPKYSFGKESRFPNLINKKSSSFTSDTNNKLNLNSFRAKNNSSMNDINNLLYLKYSRQPKWAFSKSERTDAIKLNKYDYYNSSINYENKNKIWDSRIIGGDIGIESRFNDAKKFLTEAQRPGPGGYNPNLSFYKYHRNNYGYMGIKTNAKKDKDKNKNNSRNKFYNVNCQIGSNINNFKFDNSPKFIFGTSKRDLEKKNNGFIVDDRYIKYSAFGEQIMAQKNSRPIYSFGKQERFNKYM